MKIIKIMIAASEEMHEEKLEFTNLIEHLNEVLEPRGIELKRIKWNPETDGSIEDYKAKLKECEMCLTLYWHDLAGNSEEELDTAYQELKDGNNPRNLYVFFKEPTKDLTVALKDFKANFVTKYGHFFCKFENVDTMNLHFILQFEVYQNNLQSGLIDVSDGKVSVGGRAIVNLSNIGFAAFNKDYKRLQYELTKLDREISSLSKKQKKNNGGKALAKQLRVVKAERKKIKEEFDAYQLHLYSIALNFAKKSAEQYTERMVRARELFEQGNVIEADRILDIGELKREANAELARFEQQQHNLELKIEEFVLKADTVMANTSLSVPVRFRQACEAVEEAINIARKINYDEDKYAKLLYSYAVLLQQFNYMKEAVDYYQKALNIRRRLAAFTPDVHQPILAEMLNNLGALFSELHHYNDAEKTFQEALKIYRQLTSVNSDAYLQHVALSLCNLGALLINERRLADAEKYFQEGLEIRRKLTASNPGKYQLDLADTLCNFGALQAKLKHIDDAERSFQEALLIYNKQVPSKSIEIIPSVSNVLTNLGNLKYERGCYSEAEKALQDALKLRRMLADSNPDAFLPYLAQTLYNLGAVQYHLDKYDEAKKECVEALRILRPLASSNPDAYLPNLVIALTNYGSLLDHLGNHADAEENIMEALEINRRLAVEKPDIYISNVADSLNNIAIVQKNLEHYAEAENSYQEALSIYRKLVKVSSDTYEPDLAQTLGNYGNLLIVLDRYKEAEKYYSEALTLYLQLTNKYPGTYQTEIAKMIKNMSDAQENIGPGLITRQLFTLREWCKNVYNSIIRLSSN